MDVTPLHITKRLCERYGFKRDEIDIGELWDAVRRGTAVSEHHGAWQVLTHYRGVRVLLVCTSTHLVTALPLRHHRVIESKRIRAMRESKSRRRERKAKRWREAV